jgi:hypothetical protein
MQIIIDFEFGGDFQVGARAYTSLEDFHKLNLAQGSSWNHKIGCLLFAHNKRYLTCTPHGKVIKGMFAIYLYSNCRLHGLIAGVPHPPLTSENPTDVDIWSLGKPRGSVVAEWLYKPCA